MSERTIQQTALEKANDGQAPELIPPVDVYENGNGYLVNVDLPGAREQDVKLTLERGKLALEVAVEHPRQGRLIYRRQFALPSLVDAEKVQARLSAGVLTLELPKTAESRETRIQIKAA